VLEQFPNDVNYVVKHYPLANHQLAHPSALAALAAGIQGQFWGFHSQLLENHNQISEQKILEIAAGMGLDMDRFNQDRQSAASRQLIQDDLENGRRIGVRGTPSLFMNGKRINNRDIGSLSELIRRELAKLK
jgi:protein-disulfide isomerase